MDYIDCLMKTKTKLRQLKVMCQILCVPKKNGYGDYVIMDIDRDGKIENWKADLSDFQDDAE